MKSAFNQENRIRLINAIYIPPLQLWTAHCIILENLESLAVNEKALI